MIGDLVAVPITSINLNSSKIGSPVIAKVLVLANSNILKISSREYFCFIVFIK